MTSPFPNLTNVKHLRMATTESIANKDYFMKKCRVHAAIKKKLSEKHPEFNTDEMFTDESIAKVTEKMTGENLKLLEAHNFEEELQKIQEIKQNAPSGSGSDWKPSFVPAIDNEAKIVISKQSLLEKITAEYEAVKNKNSINETLLANKKTSLDAKVKKLNSL
ncbi:Oidioi.mRNA.OKI2018_I69.chr1.g3072.t1.cds [Oikopleura dioica]|uniref:Oidioi.mRNA.OKI2018_I69.chr1.g3072.t1.cds n=1 Tax=Oikopleura dioica TaxID=34765 RepID=A0ABN7SXD3_OIKDI|nr:Oidioi.mRNA.OKI2018_I69.chr1.g3072.t1.cds [Oikopleura dioica]